MFERFVGRPKRLQVCQDMAAPTLHGLGEGLNLAEIALRIDGIGGENGVKMVRAAEILPGAAAGVKFFQRDTKGGGRSGCKGQAVYRRKLIDTRLSADFQGFFGGSPGIGGGKFECANDMGVAEHEKPGVVGGLMAGHDLGPAKQMADEVDGMDV